MSPIQFRPLNVDDPYEPQLRRILSKGEMYIESSQDVKWMKTKKNNKIITNLDDSIMWIFSIFSFHLLKKNLIANSHINSYFLLSSVEIMVYFFSLKFVIIWLFLLVHPCFGTYEIIQIPYSCVQIWCKVTDRSNADSSQGLKFLV